MSVFANYSKKQSVVLVSKDLTAQQMFQGKTIGQIGQEFGVAEEDFNFVDSVNPKNNQTITSISIKIKGVDYVFPMSREMSKTYQDLDVETLLNCEARVNYLSVKDAEGNPSFDDQGKIILSETEKVLTIGLPSGALNFVEKRNGIETALANTEVTA
jgi:hypothetical protein